MLCLGLDSGTTTCKGLVLDLDTGKVLAQASVPHSFIEGLPPGHVEQDPQTWSDAAEHDIARALIEGLVIGLAQGMNRLIGLGIEARELHITGGGAKTASMRQIVADIFGLPVIGFKMIEGGALGAAIQAGWTYCETKGEPRPLEKIVKSAVKTDRKTRAEPRKENQALDVELRGRHADLTRKLASSGYL